MLKYSYPLTIAKKNETAKSIKMIKKNKKIEFFKLSPLF
jgi:hypothetical protein